MQPNSERPETNLVQVPIRDIRSAPGLFGCRFDDCTPLVFTPVFSGYRVHRIVVFVPFLFLFCSLLSSLVGF